MPLGILVPLLFFCSGGTALIYEVIWSKYLGQMMGSTIHAQTVVLAVFMGGLALGNRWFGRRAASTQDPLAFYGGLELAIGLYGFFFPNLFSLADRLFIAVGDGSLDQPGRLLALKLALSLGMLAVPTVLMGGTLPLLANWLQRTSPDHARAAARFYALNSLGAVCGAAIAGFALIPGLGMVSSLQATGLVNVLIWLTALILSRTATLPRKSKPAAAPQEPAAHTAGENAEPLWLPRVLVAATGGVSMGLEVLASRSLSLIFGASLHAFAVVLMGFILGIGIGAAVISSPRVRRWPRTATVTTLLASASLLLSAYVFFIDDWAEVYRHLRSGIAHSTMGYRYHLLLNTVIAVVVLGLPAGLLGAMVPLFIRDGNSRDTNIADRIGTLLTWNTVGAVAGVLLTGFGLMPHLGIRNAFGTMAALLGAIALLTAFRSRERRPLAVGGIALACAIVALIAGTEDWRYVFTSGLFRNRESEVVGRAVDLRRKNVELLYYKDAPDATVSVERNRSGAEQRVMRVNGKPDASSTGDLSTQYLLAHLPMLARPESEDVFVLGFGSGITAGAAAAHPIKSLTIAENCQPVLEASRWFDPWNRGVLTNRIARVVAEDGRTVLKLDAKRYDVIISEPSNPWMAGVGSVFSTEFYQLAASRLKDGGIMAQWFHVYEINDHIVRLVLRTFGNVFPFFEIWDTLDGDIVLLGSQKPWQTSLDNFRKVYNRPGPAADLRQVGLTTPESVWARQMVSTRLAWAVAGPGGVQSDTFPVLEYEAPRAFFVGGKSELFEKFDERTWLRDLAPTAKQGTLAALDFEALQAVFRTYPSVNPFVLRYLQMRARNQDSQPAYQAATGANPMPSVFRGPISWTQSLPPAAPADERVRALARAEHQLMTQFTPWKDAATSILATLSSAKGNSITSPNQPTPMHYASLAAMRALAHGNATLAQQLAEAALGFDESHAIAGFIARLASQPALFPAQP